MPPCVSAESRRITADLIRQTLRASKAPARPMRVDLLLPVLWQIARIPPQHPLQLLGRQPASKQSPHVHLGSLDERLTETLIQAGAAVVGERRPEWIHPYGKTAWSAVRYSVIAPA